MLYIIKSYCAGQAFPPQEASGDKEKDSILKKIKKDLEDGQLKIKAGLGDVPAEVLCVDIYENKDDTGSLICESWAG